MKWSCIHHACLGEEWLPMYWTDGVQTTCRYRSGGNLDHSLPSTKWTYTPAHAQRPFPSSAVLDSWTATCDPLAVQHCVSLLPCSLIWEKSDFMWTPPHLGGIQLKNLFQYRAETISRDQYSLPCNQKCHKKLRTATPHESIHKREDFKRPQHGSVIKTHFICLHRDRLLLLFSNRLNVSLRSKLCMIQNIAPITSSNKNVKSTTLWLKRDKN